jgi:transposase
MMKALATWSPAPYLNETTVEREASRWLITAHSRERAFCPVWGVQSNSRHSFYSRTLGDLSAQGTPVTIRVRVDRWRCRNERCDRRIFTERLPGIAAPSARQTDRLADIVRLFGHSAGGRPSSRLMARLGMCVSRTTIVRRLKQHTRTKLKRAAIRVAGVDEWAWQKDAKFGTIVVDLNRRRQIVNVDALKAASAEFTTMRRLAMRFRGRLRGGLVEKLDVWLTDRTPVRHLWHAALCHGIAA